MISVTTGHTVAYCQENTHSALLIPVSLVEGNVISPRHQYKSTAAGINGEWSTVVSKGKSMSVGQGKKAPQMEQNWGRFHKGT